jgi:hypothetical protein
MLGDLLLALLVIGYSFHVVYTYNFLETYCLQHSHSLKLPRYRDSIRPHSPVKPTRVPARANLDPPQRRKSLVGYEDLLWERLVDFDP